MDYKDYYKILGVSRDADEKEIKRAYRQLALKYHPDKNPDDSQAEERFKEINEAYEVLGDRTKRAKYDQLGASYRQWERMGGRAGEFDWSRWASGAPGGIHVEFGDFGDLFGGGFSEFFNTVFGGGMGADPRGPAASSGRVRGRDLQQRVSITLEEAFKGTTRIVRQNGRNLEVKIPPGARNGTKVRLAGQGGAGRGRSGDLYLTVEVRPDARFRRQGADLHTDIAVDLYAAVLGGEIEVPTVTGSVVLTIPPGSQPGSQFRLRGQGMPRLRNPQQRGDLFAHLDVKIPEKLSGEERRMFERLADLSGS